MTDSDEQPDVPMEGEEEVEGENEVEDEDENDAEVEEKDEETDLKDYWYVPVYVTCRICTGVYKFPVKTKCCKANACKACGHKQATKLKKCWNADCEKPLTTASLQADEDQKKTVEKWYMRMKKWDDNLKTGKILKCTLCDNICQRGVSTPCCGVVACRGCAVKKIAGARECWHASCKAPDLTSENLVNDEVLRKAVEHYKENGVVDVAHAKEISAKRSDLHRAIFEKNKKAKLEKKEKNKEKEKSKSRRDPPNSKKNKPGQKQNNFGPQGWGRGSYRGMGPNRGGQGPRNWREFGGPGFHGNGMGGPPFHGNGMGGPPFQGNGMGGPPFQENDMYVNNLEREHAQMKMMLMNNMDNGMGMAGRGGMGGRGPMGMRGGGPMGMRGGSMGMRGGGMGMRGGRGMGMGRGRGMGGGYW